MIRLDDVVQVFDVRCTTSLGSSPSYFRRWIAFGYDASLSVVIDHGGVAHRLQGFAQETISCSGVPAV